MLQLVTKIFAKRLASWARSCIILYMDSGIEKEKEMEKIAFGLWLDYATGFAQADDGFGNLLPVAYTKLIYSAGDANLVYDLF